MRTRVPPATQRLRRRVLERDRFTCAECGLDCEEARALVLAAKSNLSGAGSWERTPVRYRPLALAKLTGLNEGLCKIALSRVPADVDHIVPRVECGTNEETNLRTLCVVCHREKTSSDATRLAKHSTKYTRASK